jgi:hypothetical protein
MVGLGLILGGCGRTVTNNPVAVATATPTTASTPIPTPTDCQLPHDGAPGCIPECSFGHGTGTGEGAECPQSKANPDDLLFDEVRNAVLQTEAEHPDLIVVESNTIRLSNENRLPFFRIVVHKLQGRPGICAADDGLEVAVKRNNDFSEQYKFWTTPPKNSNLGTLRVDGSMKIATCRPAWF